MKQKTIDMVSEWLYDSKFGRFVVENVLKKEATNRWVGRFFDTELSALLIDYFVKEQGININEFAVPEGGYKTFNNFFHRKFKEGARPFFENPNELFSPAEGKVFAYEEINPNQLFQIKGRYFNLDDLVKDNVLDKYGGGEMITIRLAPRDFHCFHFVDDGEITNFKEIGGDYYTVDRPGLLNVLNLFCQNRRDVTYIKTENFGDLIYVEVGATFVGSIKQKGSVGEAVERGKEKGYFKFGASTVILMLEKGKVKLRDDLVKNTRRSIETEIKLGEELGYKLK